MPPTEKTADFSGMHNVSEMPALDFINTLLRQMTPTAPARFCAQHPTLGWVVCEVAIVGVQHGVLHVPTPPSKETH